MICGIFVTFFVVSAFGREYDNCAVISAEKDFTVQWTREGNNMHVEFSALSSGYVCLGMYRSNGRDFTLRGHAGDGENIDMWCAYGNTLRDNHLEGEDVKSDNDDLTNKVVVSSGDRVTASFTRKLAGNSDKDQFDFPFLLDQPTKLAWAIHPTRRNNGGSRHPRGPDRQNEANAGTKGINWGSPSKCVVEQESGSFVSGSGTFSLKYGLVPNNPAQMEFTMSAQATGWISFGWTEGSRAHVASDMYTGWVSGTTCNLQDTWSTSKSRPPEDGNKNIVAGSVSCSEMGGKTTITFRRAISTGDTLTDLVIANKPVLFQWAFASSDNPATRHTDTGTGSVNFLASPGAAPLTLPPTPAPTPAPPPQTTSTSFTADGGKFKLSWSEVSADTLKFTMEAQATGYVGIGWTALSGKSHSNTDMIVGWVNGGTNTLLDTFSTGKAKPATDAQNDVQLVSATQANGKTTITFTRKLNTGDSKDVPISTAPLLVQWAYHSTNDFNGGAVHDRFGSLPLTFLEAGAGGPPPTLPPTPAPTPSPPPKTTGSSVEAAGGKFKMAWTVAGANIEFSLDVEATGYIGIGWTALSGKSHVASDMIIAWMEGSTGRVVDTFSTSKAKPTDDATQDVTVVSASRVSGRTKMVLRRKLDTGDSKDVALTNAPVLFQWAVHSGSYSDAGVHDEFGSLALNFLSQGGGPQLTVPPTPAPTLPPPPEVSGSSASADGGKFKLDWKVEGAEIEMTMTAETNGYAAIGWAVEGTKSHKNSDMIAGWVDDAGKTVLRDTFSNAKSKPPTDAQEDVSLVKSSQKNGVTTITFRRKLDTGDSADVPITNAPLVVQWAYHSNDAFDSGELHARRGELLINFLSDEPLPQPSPVPTMPDVPMTMVGDTPGLLVAGEGKFRLNWHVDGERIHFELECGATGYCGFGLATSTTEGGHKKADMSVFWVDSMGQLQFRDAYSDSPALPENDPSNDLETVIGSEDGGQLSVSFSRLLNTGDPKDVTIVDAPMLVQWAVHSTDAYEDGEFHDEFGMLGVNFLSEDKTVIDTSSENLKGETKDETARVDTGPMAEEEGGLGTTGIILIAAGCLCLCLIVGAMINLFLIKKK